MSCTASTVVTRSRARVLRPGYSRCGAGFARAASLAIALLFSIATLTFAQGVTGVVSGTTVTLDSSTGIGTGTAGRINTAAGTLAACEETCDAHSPRNAVHN